MAVKTTNEKMASTASSAGIGLGSAIAVTISWSLNHSVFWCIVHGIFSWLYVIYYLLQK